MKVAGFARSLFRNFGLGVTLFSTVLNLVEPPSLAAQTSPAAATTPIQHVIIIIGENRSFDHVYATYKPKHRQTVSNLLSRAIVNADGTPGPNYLLSAQYSAVDSSMFDLAAQGKAIYGNTPPPLAGGATKASDTSPAPFATLRIAKLAEPDLFHTYNKFLLTGATGLAHGVVDTRITNVNNLGQGVFQLTPGVKYDDYANSPVHRFYQMWQQTDCDTSHATASNPSGCLSDLFPWVETTIGAGSNGKPQPTPFTNLTTGEGSTAMAFYNVQQGDAPYMKELADQYTLSDNFHQSVEGGTGANHIMFGYADAMWYSDGNGNALTPVTNQIEVPIRKPEPTTIT